MPRLETPRAAASTFRSELVTPCGGRGALVCWCTRRFVSGPVDRRREGANPRADPSAAAVVGATGRLVEASAQYFAGQGRPAVLPWVYDSFPLRLRRTRRDARIHGGFVVRGHDQRHSHRLDSAGAPQLQATQMLACIQGTFPASSG